MQGAEQIHSIQGYDNDVASPEREYTTQIGLKDLDFDVNDRLAKSLGLTIPFSGIDQAENALMHRALTVHSFNEMDDTPHTVLVFDPRPIGYSGFMNCARHSLSMTNLGIFEIGRYQGVSLTPADRYWQWFIHRRLATIEETNRWMEEGETTPEQLIEQLYQAFTTP
jgi:hypothetical protein